jgi:hypothetical protein
MAVTTISLYDLLTDSSDAPIANVQITLTFGLNFATTTDGLLQPSVRTATTDATGKWTFAKVIPNDLIAPANTTYAVQTPFCTYQVAPQSGNGASQQSTAANVIVNNPLALAPYAGLSSLTVSGPLTVTGLLTAASAAITGAFSAGISTISGLLTAAAGFVISGGTGATLNASGDFAGRSVTVSSGGGPYTATAVAGGADFAGSVRFAGPEPEYDAANPIYGVKTDGTDAGPALAALLTAIGATNAVVKLPRGTILCLTNPGLGSAQGQVIRYEGHSVESTYLTRGFNGDLFNFKGAGGVSNMTINDDGNGSHARTGAAIKITATSSGLTAGNLYFGPLRITSSEALGSWERIINMDGSLNTFVGGNGVRAIFLDGVCMFGARTVGETMRLLDAVHLYVNGGGIYASPTAIRQGISILDSNIGGGLGSVDVHVSGFENEGDLVSAGQYLSWVGGRIGSGTGGVAPVTLTADAQSSFVLSDITSGGAAISVLGTNNCVLDMTSAAQMVLWGKGLQVPTGQGIDTSTAGGTLLLGGTNAYIVDMSVPGTSTAQLKLRTASWGSLQINVAGTNPGDTVIETGNATALKLGTAGVTAFGIDTAGHWLALRTGGATLPVITNLGANVTSVTPTGNDSRFKLVIVMAGALAANTRICTVTYGTTYGATPFTPELVDQTSGAGLANVGFYAGAEAAASFDLFSNQALALGTYTVRATVDG